ncbi:MAG: hypothetical protein LBP69_10105 [Treponema sp.]|jgi:uncharacterized integral membrane protein|nr:hypothetical protein [Treponema sp.]
MPWRLIGLIIILAVLLAFIGFNLDNTCAISFGFTRIDNVPVYLTVFASFVLGMLMSVPFLISFAIRKKKPKAPKKGKTTEDTETLPPSDGGPYGID